MTESPQEIPPVLHGDGVTDDTAAVQWYLDRDLPLPKSERGYSVDVAALRNLVGGYGYVRPDAGLMTDGASKDCVAD